MELPDNISDEQLKNTYKEEVLTQKQESEFSASLDMSYAGWSVVIKDIAKLDSHGFTQARRKGLGGSDSSVVLGVNPYKTREELIEEKVRDELSAEELAIGEKVAVRKGNDLEPLVIKKFGEAFNRPIWKPVDMYQCDEFPYLKMNFDGVTGTPNNYIPVEIKIVTASGERHYNPSKSIYTEGIGMRPLPEDVSNNNISIQAKAAHYGIPPYYYTQLQQEMMASGAPYGFLSTLYDKSWTNITYFAWKDAKVQTALITEGWRVWQEVVRLNPSRAL